MKIFALGVAVAVVVLAVALAAHRDNARRARLLRRVCLRLTAGYVLFAAAFAAGEAVVDPGGWRAAGLILAWAVPLAAAVGSVRGA
ncbi:MAG TPA: hypothetical protein VFM55_08910 [Micromonosporaceae bacterium]|nr:hypothetical protein [Micromonosporaceae bacterium]